MWLLEKKIHRQTDEYAMRGLVEEQLMLQQSTKAAKEAGFIVCKQLPDRVSQFNDAVQQTATDVLTMQS